MPTKKLKASFEPKVSEREDKQQYVPEAKWYRRPACWLTGHDRPINEKGWQAIYCGVCGQSQHHMTLLNWWRRGIFHFQLFLVNLANSLETDDSPATKTPFRRVDTKLLKDLGTKHSCDAYSYEGIISMLKQYEDDGLPEPKLSRLVSEDGWVDINDDNAKEITELINKSFEEASNRQERKRTMEQAGLGERLKCQSTARNP